MALIIWAYGIWDMVIWAYGIWDMVIWAYGKRNCTLTRRSGEVGGFWTVPKQVKDATGAVRISERVP